MLAPVLEVTHVTDTRAPFSIVSSEGFTDSVGVLGITEIRNKKFVFKKGV